jgi:hypothetical protein
VIFSKLIEDRDMVRKLLISKYKNLIKWGEPNRCQSSKHWNLLILMQELFNL